MDMCFRVIVRTCGVVLGPRCVRYLFKSAFDCVYQFVHLFRDADCVVCLLLSVNFFCGRFAPLFEGRYRAIPSIAKPRCVGRGCGAGFCRRGDGSLFLFTFHVLVDLTYLLLMECVLWFAAEGIALLVLFTTVFFWGGGEIVAVRVPKNHQALG